ncbi:MAG TPA: response regulator [Bacteroidales bacterium]|nr:response regulator [Bacteroidales bacterium]
MKMKNIVALFRQWVQHIVALTLKNTRLFVLGVVLCMLLGNVFLFVYVFIKQKSYQEAVMLQQAETFTSHLEQDALMFINDFNQVAFHYIEQTSNQVSSGNLSPLLLEKIKLFYAKHQPLVSNVYLVDTALRVVNVYCDPSGNFLIDSYESKQRNSLQTTEKLVIRNGEYLYTVPLFREGKLVANLVASLNIKNYFRAQLQTVFVGKVIFQDVYTPLGTWESLPLLKVDFNEEVKRLIDRVLQTNKPAISISPLQVNGSHEKYLHVFYPFKFLNTPFVYLYHFQIQYIVRQVFLHSILLIGFNLILLFIVIFYYLQMVRNKNIEEEKLRESEEAFKEIIESMPIGIILTTKNNQIISINKLATRILQISNSGELIGKNISHKFLTTKSLAFDDEIASAFETDHFIQYESNGNEIVLYKKDIPLRLKGEEIVVQSFIDVTPIEKSRKREIAANMAKSEFLAKMSHEIRTPMNGIVGMADALLSQPLTKEQIEFVTIIKKSADTLLNILNDVLDLSKIEAGKMILEEIPFELRKELALVAHLFKVPAEEKKLSLQVEVEPSVPEKVIGDPFRLRQILTNLINNAIKFTHEGKIVIAVKKVEDYNRNLLLQFKVADTGIGIPKDKLSKVFQSFSQVDNSTTRKYGGTGLGTTIAKQLVELMNGEIMVESPSGISDNPDYPGTCFTFTIELFSNEKQTKSIDTEKVTSFQQIKTLLITNQTPDDNSITETFALFNVSIEVHRFTKSTIDSLKKNALTENVEAKYQLLVIRDTPHFDGFKLLARLQEAQLVNAYHILIISNNDRQGNFLRALRMGADHYIIMPYETSEIFNFLCETFVNLKLEDEIAKFKVQQLRPNLKILVAEDNPINQKVAFTLFKNIGYEVDFAKNGLEVLDMLKKQHYDIIFMDIMMPEMDGIQATLEIRKSGSRIPIIAMTANISKDESREALNDGMDDYVTKPVRIDTVKKILIKLFSHDMNQ